MLQLPPPRAPEAQAGALPHLPEALPAQAHEPVHTLRAPSVPPAIRTPCRAALTVCPVSQNAVSYVRKRLGLTTAQVARHLGARRDAVEAMEAYGRLPAPLARWVLRILPPKAKRAAMLELGYSRARKPRTMKGSPGDSRRKA